MAKTKEQKKQILDNLIEKISKAKSIVFTKFNGLTVKENEELRNKLRAEGGEYYVAKKTLMNLAFKDKQISGLEIKKFTGQIATIFGYEDEVSPARIVDKFRKEKEGKIEFIAGILGNKLMTEIEVSELAKLPTKQELYTKVVGSINAPISGLVNVLAANLRSLVYVLKAVGEKK